MYNPRARRLLSLQAPEPVTCAAPQVDGTAVLLTGVASGAIHVWQVNTAAQLTSLCDAASLGNAVSSLSWENGSAGDTCRLYAGFSTGSIKLWDLDRGQVVGTLKGHKVAPTSLSHCRFTSMLASGSQDTTVKLWDPRGRDAVATLKGQGGAITHVQHSPDGLLVVSGSTEGLIQVWDARSCRLLRDLKQHTKSVHSLAFHPEEQLLASCSADRTVRFWDLGSFEQCDKAGPVAKEVRAVAFPSDGRAVLGASVDGLRTYSWEPSETYDMVDIPWAKVSELTYCDGKAFGLAFINCMVDMWTVDLTQVRPFGEPRRPSSCLDRRRLSHQEALVQGGMLAQSLDRFVRQSEQGTSLYQPPQPPAGPGPAAHFVAERRRQLKTAVTKPVAPTQESLVAPGLRAVPAQRDCPIRAASAAGGPRAGSLQQLQASSSTCSVGSDCSTPSIGHGQHSARENLLTSEVSSSKPSNPREAVPQQKCVEETTSCKRTSSCSTGGGMVGNSALQHQPNGLPGGASHCTVEGLSLEAADGALVGHADVRALLRARSQQLREIRGLLARGDMRGSFHAIKAYQDLAITMQVVSKWAALPDPPLELCIEAAALCENLLSSSEAVNQDTGLQMVSRMLRRWAAYISGALTTQFARQGVDLQYDDRRERCLRCREQLQTLLPALNKLTATRNSQASQLVTTILTL